MGQQISRRQLFESFAKASLLAAGVSSASFAVGSQQASYSVPAEFRDRPFDVHQHLAAEDEIFSDFRSANALIAKDYDARVRIMDANGIGQSLMLAGTLHYDKTNGIENTKRLNDLVAAYVAKHSDRFPIGAGTVEPTHGDASLRELERMATGLKMRGVVWHHANCGVEIDAPFMRPILRQVAELQLIPFIHVYRKDLEAMWRLEVLAEEFPNITFVALAGLATLDDHRQALHIGRRRPNILFDTGPVLFLRESGIEDFVRKLGAHRLLFGSDLYATGPSYRRASTTLEVLKHAQISEEDTAKILYGNLSRLVGRG